MGAVAMAGACGVRIINILISKDRKNEITALRSAMERTFSKYSGYAFNFIFLKKIDGYSETVYRNLTAYFFTFDLIVIWIDEYSDIGKYLEDI